MSVALLLGIAGLAVLDSFNPATLVAVTLILLAAPKRAGLIALSAVCGAAITVFGLGAILFLSAESAAGAVDGIITGLRFIAFGAAAVALIASGLRRFTDRPRKAIGLPEWFSPLTALPFGIMLTAADLPNAFPYFIAIERLVAAQVGVPAGVLLLVGYTVIYCLPCLVLLAVGVMSRDQTHAWLTKIVRRFGTGAVKRSVPAALSLIVTGVAVGSVPFWIG